MAESVKAHSPNGAPVSRGIELSSPTDFYDAISMRLGQASAIARMMGSANPDDLHDVDNNYAATAIGDLLEEVRELSYEVRDRWGDAEKERLLD